MKRLRAVLIALVVLLLAISCQQQPLKLTTVAENVFFAWPRKDTTVFFREEITGQDSEWSIWSLAHGTEILLSSWPHEIPINPIVSPSGDNVLVWQLNGKHLLLHLQGNQVSWSPLRSGFLTWDPDGEYFLGDQGLLLEEPQLGMYDFTGQEQRRLEQASLNFGEFLKNLMERNHCGYSLLNCYWINNTVVFVLARVSNVTSQPEYDMVSLQLDDFSITEIPVSIQGHVLPSPNGERLLYTAYSKQNPKEWPAFVYDLKRNVQISVPALDYIGKAVWSLDSNTLYYFRPGVNSASSNQNTTYQIAALSMSTGEERILYAEVPSLKFYPFLQNNSLVYATPDDQLISCPLPMP